MFECFVRSHVCLSVSPSRHRKQLTCVNVAFYFKLGFGWEGRGFESESLYWGWGKCSFKIEFFWGGGCGFTLNS